MDGGQFNTCYFIDGGDQSSFTVYAYMGRAFESGRLNGYTALAPLNMPFSEKMHKNAQKLYILVLYCKLQRKWLKKNPIPQMNCRLVLSKVTPDAKLKQLAPF